MFSPHLPHLQTRAPVTQGSPGVPQTLTYDAMGNLIQDGLGNAYRYDGETRLREVQMNNGVLQVSTFNADAQRKTVQVMGGTKNGICVLMI